MDRKSMYWTKQGLIILFISPLFLIFAGCGKIGDPVPPDRAMPRSIIDLSAKEEGAHQVKPEMLHKYSLLQ
jgi:hypothetical protein